ncbi:MAG: hypothetical protein AAF402_08740 [Pseudomonadota bacterium]
MSIKKYLDKFRNAEYVNLVGPLCQEPWVHNDPTIYVDGGALFRDGSKGWSVGDGDSAGFELDEMLNPYKDESDLAYVLTQLTKLGPDLRLAGFLGGRKDHELFNLGELNRYLEQSPGANHALFDDLIIGISAGVWNLDINGLFSLASVSHGHAKMSGACRYAIPPGTPIVPLSSYGLSNVGTGNIEISTNVPLFLFHSESDTVISKPRPIKNDGLI